LEGGQSFGTATPVKASKSDIAMLAKITGLSDEYLAQVTESEFSNLGPLLDEHNLPDTDIERKHTCLKLFQK
jgi:hypothetical protein